MATTDNKKSLPYRPCVGVALFNMDGLVFVGERIDTPGAWQMPQGGIDEGETIEQAAFRELHEEVGTDKAEILKIHDEKLRYSIPEHVLKEMGLWDGKYTGQEQTWVAMRFTGEDTDINLNHHVEPEFSAWQWIELEKTPDLIVPFKRNVYLKLIEMFQQFSL